VPEPYDGNIASRQDRSPFLDPPERGSEVLLPLLQPLPSIGVVLGSGLGGFLEEIEGMKAIPLSSLPGFPEPTTEGHTGKICWGQVADRTILVMAGRYHYYEGYTMTEIAYPIRLMYSLGIRRVILTCVSGGIGEDLKVGEVVLVSDHLNLMGNNPLLGIGDSRERSRFVDLSSAYDEELLRLAEGVARSARIPHRRGVLAAMAGPCYETPSEVRMLKRLGADIVSMSVVPEVIMAAYLGMKVLCLSLVTNLHLPGCRSGRRKRLHHAEVLSCAEKYGGRVRRLLREVLAKWPDGKGQRV